MQRRWAAVAAVAGAAVVTAGAWLVSASKVSDAEFTARHWRQPLAPQGPAPAGFGPIERSLAPQSCGMCHPAQFDAGAGADALRVALAESRRSAFQIFDQSLPLN